MEPEERALLRQIMLGDDASRGVYADWLEERGMAEHAEYVRLQGVAMRATEPDRAFVEASRRLRDLAPLLDLSWRTQVARAPVEGCKRLQFEVPCPADWAKMQPTADANVRHCGACAKQVRYCTTEEDALRVAERGECVVLDLTASRPRTTCASCGHVNLVGAATCTRCQYPMPVVRRPPPLAGAPMPVRPIAPFNPPPPTWPSPKPPPPPPTPRAGAGARWQCSRCSALVEDFHPFCSQCGSPRQAG